MNGFVRVYKIILLCKVEVIEIVGLEYWFDLTVFILLAFLVQITICLNNGTMSLALAKKHEMLLPNRIKRLTVLMTHDYPTFGLVIKANFNQSNLSIKRIDNIFGSQES